MSNPPPVAQYPTAEYHNIASIKKGDSNSRHTSDEKCGRGFLFKRNHDDEIIQVDHHKDDHHKVRILDKSTKQDCKVSDGTRDSDGTEGSYKTGSFGTGTRERQGSDGSSRTRGGKKKGGGDDDNSSGVSYSWWLLPLTAFLVLMFGTSNLLLLQWMWRQDVYLVRGCNYEGCPIGKFSGSFFAQFINSAAQMLCMGLFYIDRIIAKLRGTKIGWLEYYDGHDDGKERRDNNKHDDDDDEDEHDSSHRNYQNGAATATANAGGGAAVGGGKRLIKEKEEPSCYVWIFPAFLDFGASMLVLYALSIEQASTVQILRTFAVVFCALMSVTYLHRDLKLYQWIGIIILTIGLLITCWDSLFSEKQPSEEVSGHYKRWLSFSAVILSTIVNMFQLVYEERITGKYKCSPFKAVGWIGTFELFIVIIAMLIAHFLSYENIILIWYQVSLTPNLQYAILFISISVAGFMSLGLAVTKMGAALLTASINALRQVPIWATELILGWYIFDWVALLGMIITIIGFAIYNKLYLFKSLSYKLDQTVKIRLTCHDIYDDEEYYETGDQQTDYETGDQHTDYQPSRHRTQNKNAHHNKRHKGPKYDHDFDILDYEQDLYESSTSSVFVPKSQRIFTDDAASTASGNDEQDDQQTNPAVIIIQRSEEWVVQTTDK